jgi:hypothetical protein
METIRHQKTGAKVAVMGCQAARATEGGAWLLSFYALRDSIVVGDHYELDLDGATHDLEALEGHICKHGLQLVLALVRART